LSSSAIAPTGASAESLLRWYDRHRRRLPWRALPGKVPDPYHVWLSEIMLQQTTVGAVIPYYERFLIRFPTVESLAAAPLDDVLTAWAGLGYYARARNLHACARTVAAAGGFPRDLAGLGALPGIGEYTARAVGAIAFDVPAVPVDGNVERVVARLFGVEAPLPGAKPVLRGLADRLGADPDAAARPGDFAQALFDLGATVCTPASPACGLCPWMAGCAGRLAGIAGELPRRGAKPARPLRHGVHFWLEDAGGNVLLRRRPEAGLLGGMAELPGTDWRALPWRPEEALALAPMAASWRPAGQVRHGFTHFALTLELFAARVDRVAAEGFLHPVGELRAAALPSVMRKCVAMAAGLAGSSGGAAGRGDAGGAVEPVIARRAAPKQSPA
jgi:A/G-specific adenine glycosylase